MPLEKKIFYSKTLGIFKKASVLTLFSFINSPKKKQKLTEGKITNIQFSNNLCFIDFGFKAEIEIFFNELNLRIPKLSSVVQQCNFIKQYSILRFKITNLNNFFLNKIEIKLKKTKLSSKILFYILLKQKKKRIFLKGRLINVIRGGFSVGLCGYIAFLPKSHSFFKFLGKVTLFFLLSLNFIRKSFVVSQRSITKIVKRRLLKLGSRLVYIKNSGIKKKEFYQKRKVDYNKNF
jgi:ribosomal protein S1